MTEQDNIVTTMRATLERQTAEMRYLRDQVRLMERAAHLFLSLCRDKEGRWLGTANIAKHPGVAEVEQTIRLFLAELKRPVMTQADVPTADTLRLSWLEQQKQAVELFYSEIEGWSIADLLDRTWNAPTLRAVIDHAMRETRQ